MRAFIAVEVPKEIGEKIAELQNVPELQIDSIKPVEPHNMHLTLRYLGNNVTEEQVGRLKGIIGSIRFEPFTIKCAGIGVFPNIHYIRVVWAGAESGGKLEAIANELSDKLQALGFAKEDFASHLTIARVRRKVDLKEFVSKHGNDSFGEFTVKEIKLKCSKITPEGPIYTDL